MGFGFSFALLSSRMLKKSTSLSCLMWSVRSVSRLFRYLVVGSWVKKQTKPDRLDGLGEVAGILALSAMLDCGWYTLHEMPMFIIPDLLLSC